MKQGVKILAVLMQIIFAALYAFGTNLCSQTSCKANSYISLALILIALIIFDIYFLKFYPRFKKIQEKYLIVIIVIFPLLFYLIGLLLNFLTIRPLSVIIIGAVWIVVSRLLWMYLQKGKLSLFVTECLALTSLFFLIFSIIFLIANLNFAISSYLKYKSPKNDIYIVGNKGMKSTFLSYKFR